MGKSGKRRSTLPVYILVLILVYLYTVYLFVVRSPAPAPGGYRAHRGDRGT